MPDKWLESDSPFHLLFFLTTVPTLGGSFTETEPHHGRKHYHHLQHQSVMDKLQENPNLVVTS